MAHRILIVEDDPGSGEVLNRWLELEGYDTILADTLEAAFVYLAEEPLPDVVLLDIYLGKKNGLTLAHWVRRQKHLAHIQIAAITGSTCFKDLKSIQEAGCDSCFPKPIDFRALKGYLAKLTVPPRVAISRS